MIERELDTEAFPIRGGVFLAVVGASGAGKDTLLNYARNMLRREPEVSFVRRVITRESDESTEDHDTMAKRDFDRAAELGAFSLSWSAHGLKYGLPASVDQVVHAGHVAIANISRAVIPALRQRYANVSVVYITASLQIRARRLASRGRETEEEIIARLSREVPHIEGRGADVTFIANDSAIAEGGEALVSAIRRAIAQAAISDAIG